MQGAVKKRKFFYSPFLGIGKNAQNEQAERRQRVCVVCGYPTAYKGTPSGEACL